MRIVFGSDHGGAAFKKELLDRAPALAPDLQLVDLGGDGSDPGDDYPDFSLRVGRAVASGRADRGVLICGSGVGAAIAATKIRGVRASVCHDTYTARQGVEHDDMNVLCMGGRVIGIELAVECLRAFLNARFSAEPRHRRRVAKVLAIEATDGRIDEADLASEAARTLGATAPTEVDR
jgi:ribose 5-phosphate isomerase B